MTLHDCARCTASPSRSRTCCCPRSRYITSHNTTVHDSTFHYITFHYITLHYIALHYITFCCVTFLCTRCGDDGHRSRNCYDGHRNRHSTTMAQPRCRSEHHSLRRRRRLLEPAAAIGLVGRLAFDRISRPALARPPRRVSLAPRSHDPRARVSLGPRQTRKPP